MKIKAFSPEMKLLFGIYQATRNELNISAEHMTLVKSHYNGKDPQAQFAKSLHLAALLGAQTVFDANEKQLPLALQPHGNIMRVKTGQTRPRVTQDENAKDGDSHRDFRYNGRTFKICETKLETVITTIKNHAADGVGKDGDKPLGNKLADK